MISTQPIGPRASANGLNTLAEARDLPPDQQRRALEELFHSDSGELRDRAIRAAAAVLDDEAIVACVREEADDVLRNAGLEILKIRGRRAFSTAVALLRDDDAGVVLQAVLVLDAIRDPRAWPHVRPLLRHEDRNVVQAAIQSAGHLSSAGAWPELVPFLSADAWLQIAAIQALGDLRAVPAVPHLAPLFSDPFLESFVAEALGRIGDVTAVEAIADHWLDGAPALDACFFLEIASGILANLDPPPQDERLRNAAEEYLGSDDPATARAAAWCVLALGPSRADAVVLDIIAASGPDPLFPACIALRKDLAPELVRRDPPLRDWGYELLRRFPSAAPPEWIEGFIDAYPPSHVDAVAAFIASSPDPRSSVPLLSLWISRSDERDRLIAAVCRHSSSLLDLLDTAELSPGDRFPLMELIGGDAASIAAEITRLDDGRWEAVAEIGSREVVKRLPWAEWIDADGDDAVRAFASAVSRTACRELLPLLRSELAARPGRELVEAAGDLEDAESVPILAALLRHGAPVLRAAIFDSLGRIGGGAARAVLRAHCMADPSDAVHACRGLALCAELSDAPLVRAAAALPDLSARLAAISALARFRDPESRRVLRRMLFDSSAAVAQRAQSALDGAESVA